MISLCWGRNNVGRGENDGYEHRFLEKTAVLQDECLSKGTHPALISTRPFSDQFILKEDSKQIFLPPDFGR